MYPITIKLIKNCIALQKIIYFHVGPTGAEKAFGDLMEEEEEEEQGFDGFVRIITDEDYLVIW